MRLHNRERPEVRHGEDLGKRGEAHHAVRIVPSHLGPVPAVFTPARLADVVDSEIAVAHYRNTVLILTVRVVQPPVEVDDDPLAGIIVVLPVVAQPQAVERPVPNGSLLGGRHDPSQVVAPSNDSLEIRVVVEGVEEIVLVVQSDLLGLHDALSPLSILSADPTAAVRDFEVCVRLGSPGDPNIGDDDFEGVVRLGRLWNAATRSSLNNTSTRGANASRFVDSEGYGIVTIAVRSALGERVDLVCVVLNPVSLEPGAAGLDDDLSSRALGSLVASTPVLEYTVRDDSVEHAAEVVSGVLPVPIDRDEES